MAAPKALEVYDIDKYGPMLGVSDEGYAAETIANAAHKSAKSMAAGSSDSDMVAGLIIDGERMGSAGEVPIGPDEIARVVPAARDKTFCSTNVGVRVNTRIHQPLPEFVVADAKADEQAWLDGIWARFAPFINTPDNKPRPLTIRLLVREDECLDALMDLVPKIEAGRSDGKLGSADLHKLSILFVFEGEIDEDREIGQIEKLIQVAAEMGVPEVALDGKLVEAGRRRISIQGLLNVLSPDAARKLLARADGSGVTLMYHYEADPQTAARTVWTGLNSARHSGLSAAKYGLRPLKFAEQEYVVANIQRWMPDWTPIPAFYVDTALVTHNDVYESDRCVEAARIWLDMVAKYDVKVVLIDCPDRIDPHRLMKSGGPNDPGILEIGQIETVTKHAKSLGIRALWSGSIKPEQAFALGKLEVAGIFTTGSASKVVAVHTSLVTDDMLAAQVEPTDIGVRRIQALLGGGFLCSKLAGSHGEIVDEIESKSDRLIVAGVGGDEAESALDDFNQSLTRGWNALWG